MIIHDIIKPLKQGEVEVEPKELVKQKAREIILDKAGNLINDTITRRFKVIFPKIDKAADFVVKKTMDETRVEEMASAAQQGAAHFAVNDVIDSTVEDVIKAVKPDLDEATEDFKKRLYELTTEAAKEIVKEAVKIKLTSGLPAGGKLFG